MQSIQKKRLFAFDLCLLGRLPFSHRVFFSFILFIIKVISKEGEFILEMLLGLIVLLACLVFGVRHGGIGLAVISGIGLVIFTFVFGYKPGVPPIGVMLTILAVVTCAGFLQTSGGLTVMLKYAEKFLRNNPKQITILAPITTWFLTVLCGTGHVVYTMFPIIYDIAIK